MYLRAKKIIVIMTEKWKLILFDNMILFVVQRKMLEEKSADYWDGFDTK